MSEQDENLKAIAQELIDADKKVQLIYAFNGSGKTRLSRAFRELINGGSDAEEAEPVLRKMLYYNAFTEDLFFWDNDLLEDSEPKLKIQPNDFTFWILNDQGQELNITRNFQRYTNDKLTPSFNQEYRTSDLQGNEIVVPALSEVTFSMETGGDGASGILKLSKGEESNFIWSFFYALLNEVVSIFEEQDPSERENEQFNDLRYVFIDDPVSSLDDPHLIELAVDLAQLIKSCESDLKFVITTHNPLFYNVLHNELKNPFQKDRDGVPVTTYKPKQSARWRLEKLADGTFTLIKQDGRTPFSYHLLLLSELKAAIATEQLQKYHFNFLRNVLEKTATFLGYQKWGDLLPQVNGAPDPFAARIINLSSHSAHSGDEVAQLEANDKEKLVELVEYLFAHHHFREQEAQDG